MIITRSPLRVSFAGGGTDIPAFYVPYGPGVVVSTSINRYVYVTLNQKFDGKVSVRYRIHEMTDSVKELMHPLIREILNYYGVDNGIEIVIASEVPARGSGLGASSALAVALCLALERYTGRMTGDAVTVADRHLLASIAAQIEIGRVHSPIGKQDHYASAFGGFNKIEFHPSESVDVTPFVIDTDFLKELESQSMLFYMNIEHEYHTPAGGEAHHESRNFVQKILRDQVAEVHEKQKIHVLQRDNALRLWEHMEYSVPERFIDHINENWRLKRSVHNDISNSRIDAIVTRAYSKGATAAKVCGAGGGGFLYLVVPPSMQDDVRKELNELHELKFGFDDKGVECIFEEKKNYAHSR